jgi:hypothetical protein
LAQQLLIISLLLVVPQADIIMVLAAAQVVY